MDTGGFSRRTRWALLAFGACLVGVSLARQVWHALASADCVIRHRDALISCMAPPDATDVVLTFGLGIVIALLAARQVLAERR